MDVLKHIYNLNEWFEKAYKINGSFAIIFMTSANPHNPFIRKRILKLHFRAEHLGRKKTEGWKERDIEKPFYEIHKQLIKEFAPQLSENEIIFLARETRGQRQDDIQISTNEYINTGSISYKPDHPSNTCDPYTGNWTERLLYPIQLKELVQSKGFKGSYTNSFYCYSKHKKLNLVKFLLKIFIKIIGQTNLLLSPSYTITALKSKIFI
ncbi:MAG: hypothetical protein ACK40G_07945 [Cytophagaceae bacterium]